VVSFGKKKTTHFMLKPISLHSESKKKHFNLNHGII